MPEASTYCATVIFDRKVYIVGKNFSNLWIYDIESDSYTKKELELLNGKPKLVLAKDETVFIGGYDGNL